MCSSLFGSLTLSRGNSILFSFCLIISLIVCTLTVSVLDLSDKDFWTADKDKIFEQLRVYRETEEDSVKLNQYVYDYILDAYTQGKIAKKSYTVDLVVSKENGGGWLVTGDKELCAILEYENGVDVAEYILDGFEDWYMDVTLQEQLDAINNNNME